MTTELSCDEIDTLLRESGAGVLSLTDGKETYAIPESFGYDGDHLYFQFVHHPDSQKMAFLETTDTATLTVYTDTPSKSVIVRGPVEPVPDDDQTIASTAIAENADIPTLNVYPEHSPDELLMTFYQLSPTERSGRKFNEVTTTPTSN
ncbi:pyridoxamine 5'-phosphate oxidase family protein [Halobacterium sp. KA-6]|uniref:pyridoxamine 5'-phosphate oxidase family protein n=1 Tax=Halobacterium sp. KA-6 TaxID=2896368 RepID=UPI001E29DA5C|nr:pyridoxamine 5'-phosphate oxidase family protein [Halobacterium sp. KA-6]MCD2204488.1 pyridoxamine 5'-phosphate oxidase family protein [Halobacterium sp. KA-6]